MSTLLPLLALALALAAALLSRTTDDPPEKANLPATLWAAGIALVVLVASYVWKGWGNEPSQAALGFLAGAAAAILSRWLPPAGRSVGSIALAAACEGFLLWTPADWRVLPQLGAVLGASFASWILAVRAPSSISTAITPLALAAVVAADFLGSKVMAGDAFISTGTLFAIVASAAGMVTFLMTKQNPNVRRAVALGALAVALFIIGQRYLDVRDTWLLTVAGLAVGVIINWLLDEDAEESLRPLLSVVIWIALATLGFGLRRGYGMSLAMLGGVSSLVILGNVRALLTLGPLAGLVMFRVFREEHVSATRAFDIGQHYALIGLAVGALLPLIPTDWYKARASLSGLRFSFSALMWLLVLSVVPGALGLLMGPKGVVGFIAGLGFSGMVESIRSRSSLQPLGLAVGLGALTTLLYRFMDINATMTRDEKVGILVPLAVVIGVLVIVLASVSPRPAILREAEAR